MPRSRLALAPDLTLKELLAYHEDIVASLHLYFSPAAPTFISRFAGMTPYEVSQEFDLRIEESGLRSSLVLLTSLEAVFRIDFDSRCRKRLKDELSRYFREVEKSKANPDRIRLDEDILEGWKRHSNADGNLISQLRGAFKYRHWLAHGRYWVPKLPRNYDFDFVYTMTNGIVSGFPFEL